MKLNTSEQDAREEFEVISSTYKNRNRLRLFETIVQLIDERTNGSVENPNKLDEMSNHIWFLMSEYYYTMYNKDVYQSFGFCSDYILGETDEVLDIYEAFEEMSGESEREFINTVINNTRAIFVVGMNSNVFVNSLKNILGIPFNGDYYRQQRQG